MDHWGLIGDDLGGHYGGPSLCVVVHVSSLIKAPFAVDIGGFEKILIGSLIRNSCPLIICETWAIVHVCSLHVWLQTLHARAPTCTHCTRAMMWTSARCL